MSDAVINCKTEKDLCVTKNTNTQLQFSRMARTLFSNLALFCLQETKKIVGCYQLHNITNIFPNFRPYCAWILKALALLY